MQVMENLYVALLWQQPERISKTRYYGNTENAELCELVFELINEMICKFYNSKESSKFNPVHMKYDEHPGNQIAIKIVFGVNFY